MSVQDGDREAIVQVLRKAYLSKTLQILVGPMISRLSTIPGPEELGEKLAARILDGYLRVEMKNAYALLGESLAETLRKAAAGAGSEGAALASRVLDPGDYHRLLAQELYGGRETWQLPVPPVALQIASLNDVAIYTLNLDPLLELALLRVRDLALMAPGVAHSLWQKHRATWPVPSTASPQAGVRHLNGWIDPSGDAGGNLVITGADFIKTFGAATSPHRIALKELFAGDGPVLLLGIEPRSDAMRRLLSCLPSNLGADSIFAILTEGDKPATWFQSRMLSAHGIKSVWTQTPEETEIILRDIKFGPPQEGSPPPWIKQSIAWLSQELPGSEIFSDGWQAFAHIALQELVLQLRTLFAVDRREDVQCSILFPLQDGGSAQLRIVASSRTRRTASEAREMAPDFSLSIATGSEQGLSGLSFAIGCPMTSSDPEVTERNFTPAMTDRWYRDPGYKNWRSLLTLPVFDSQDWVPVALLSITSNLAQPFWASFAEAEGSEMAELFAAMRRTAKVLISEKRKDSLKEAFDRPMVDSSDPSLRGAEILQAVSSATVLTNYRGYVNARLDPLDESKTTVSLFFSPQETTEPNVTSAFIDIRDGVEAGEVEFRIECVSPNLRVQPRQAVLVTPPQAQSTELPVVCSGVAAGRNSRLFIQVFQKSRLIQVLRLDLKRPEKNPNS